MSTSPSRSRLTLALPVLLSAATALAVGDPLPDEFVSIDETVRFVPSTQPEQPDPQRPPLSTEENVDTRRPFLEWQRLTDDWGGARPKLEDRGISLNASFTGDTFRNLRGGANTADTDFVHLTNVNLTIDTERLFDLHGGTFFVNFQHVNGDEPTANVGAFQPISSIEAERRNQISELWYEQTLFAGDVLRIKVGKIDANTEFANSDNAGEFLHSSSGVSPTLLGFTTYPETAFGGLVDLRVAESFYLRGGVFDGAGQEGRTTGNHGVGTLFGSPADLLWVGEVGAEWTAGELNGRLALGVAYHTGTFDRFDGGTDDGTVGYYLVLDQQLTKEVAGDDEDEQGLSGFLRVGIADEDVSEIRQHLGGGVTYTGPLPTRDDDVVGVAANWVGFSDGAGLGGDELNVELFYKLQVTRFFSVKPDLQYIHNVGGDDALDDALVAGLRLELQF